MHFYGTSNGTPVMYVSTEDASCLADKYNLFTQSYVLRLLFQIDI